MGHSTPPTNTSPLNSPSPNTSLYPTFPSLPITHTLPPPFPIIKHPIRLTSLNATHINGRRTTYVARSLRNKIPYVISLITNHDLDILFITENWLSPPDSTHIYYLNTPPYYFILNQMINTVATHLHQIICGSLSSGSVPPDFKKAVITPIFKKPHLYSMSPSKYLRSSNA